MLTYITTHTSSTGRFNRTHYTRDIANPRLFALSDTLMVLASANSTHAPGTAEFERDLQTLADLATLIHNQTQE